MRRIAGAAALVACTACQGQSLLRLMPTSSYPGFGPMVQAAAAGGQESQDAPPYFEPPAFPTMSQVNLLHIEPPTPKLFRKHDQVLILIEESVRAQADQSLDTKKEYDIMAVLSAFPDLQKLIEDATLANGIGTPIDLIELAHEAEFKGKGKYTRNDKFQARIKAEVIDVKPNGVLVVEARKSVQKDEEIQTIVLSGTCMSEDITRQNTVTSSQLADLTLSIRNEGSVRDAARKGIVTRALEALFAF